MAQEGKTESLGIIQSIVHSLVQNTSAKNGSIKVTVINKTEKLLKFTLQCKETETEKKKTDKLYTTVKETNNILLIPCRMYINSCDSEWTQDLFNII